MADRMLFIGWGTPVRGREERGLEVFNEALGLLGRMEQDGRIEGFDVARAVEDRDKHTRLAISRGVTHRLPRREVTISASPDHLVVDRQPALEHDDGLWGGAPACRARVTARSACRARLTIPRIGSPDTGAPSGIAATITRPRCSTTRYAGTSSRQDGRVPRRALWLLASFMHAGPAGSTIAPSRRRWDGSGAGTRRKPARRSRFARAPVAAARFVTDRS